MKNRISTIKDKVEVQVKPKSPFRYFFEQEIHEQPEATLKVMGNGARLSFFSEDCTKLGGLEQHTNEIVNIENLLIIACGSSFYAGQFASKLFKNLLCFNTVQVIEASEFSEEDVPESRAGAIFISQSGETADIYKTLKICKNRGIFTIGIINVVGSLIASNVHCGVYLNAGREVAVPATKSFTNQVIGLAMVAIWISYNKKIDVAKHQRIALKN